MLSAEDVIRLLNLAPLPREGGFYRETYRSADRLPPGAVAARYANPKAASTATYYFLTPEVFSAMHALPTDEVYHFYVGDPVELLVLGPNDAGQVVVLGSDLGGGQRPQFVVPRGTWQGSRLRPGGAWALLGTTMAPGFDFDDYQPGERADLARRYPAQVEMIQRLTTD